MFGFGNKKLRAELAEARELAEGLLARAQLAESGKLDLEKRVASLEMAYGEASYNLCTAEFEIAAIKSADLARRARKAETDKLRRAAKKAKTAAMDELIASTAGEI